MVEEGGGISPGRLSRWHNILIGNIRKTFLDKEDIYNTHPDAIEEFRGTVKPYHNPPRT